MTPLLSLALCASLTLLPTTISEFTEPSSANADFAQRWFVGDTINIAWEQGWVWGVGAQPATADLFVTWFDHTRENPFWALLKSNISTNAPGTFTWEVDVDANIIAVSTQYHFRLMEHSEPAVYALSRPRLPSRGFNLYPLPAARVASSSVSAAIESATAGLPSASSSSEVKLSPPSASSTTAQSGSAGPSSDANTNVAAIAGGVVGGCVGLVLLCGIGFFLFRRRVRGTINPGPPTEKEEWAGEGRAEGCVPELTWAGVAPELDGAQQRMEMEGSTPRAWH